MTGGMLTEDPFHLLGLETLEDEPYRGTTR